MNITDIQTCAEFYQKNFLNTFYLVITYYGRSFILIGEKANFPHLMGIQHNTYHSNGYNNPKSLFNDILVKHSINTRIIPNNISPTSKMYKKIFNFPQSTDIFWKNKIPLAVNYNPAFSNTKLNNIDILLADISTGYMLGWVSNTKVPINANIRLEKYCICTWIDERAGTIHKKEKYLPNQNIELIRYVFSFDSTFKLIRQKEYSYSHHQKTKILQLCERNNSTLLLDSTNARHYINIAISEQIHCKINNTQY